MNTKLFYAHYNAIFNPKSYKHYIGKKYKYGNTIITIVGIYDDDYFEIISNDSTLKICRHINSFLSDVDDGIYKEIK